MPLNVTQSGLWPPNPVEQPIGNKTSLAELRKEFTEVENKGYLKKNVGKQRQRQEILQNLLIKERI